MKRRLFLFILPVAAVFFAALSVDAGSTRKFSIDSEGALSDGKLEGAAVHSNGSVTAGVETRRLALRDVAVARSLLVRPDGVAFVGTGQEGKIFRVVGDKVSLLADTKTLMVTSLALGPRGTLYAGTLPAGKILAVDGKGRVRTFAEPKGAEHVWDLDYDPRTKTLYAATGPEGKVFAIDAKGRPEVYYDAQADHVMALSRDSDGTLYAGTSDEALVLRLTGPGRAEVVYDFEGNEVTALAVRNGAIAVAANLFPKAPSGKRKNTAGKSSGAAKNSKKGSTASRPAPGKGHLYRLGSDGRPQRLLESTKGHFTAVQWAEDGAIYAATGKQGRVHRVAPDGTHAVWIDVDEEQVQALHLDGKHPMLITGDAGAVYRVKPGRARRAIWTSDVLDARFQARWGQLAFRGRGQLRFQTRSGNTAKPDDSWTAWSSELTGEGPIRSPAARFLQIRTHFGVSPDTVLYAVNAFYLPRNQRARVHTIAAAPSRPKKSKSAKAPAPPAATSRYAVSWKVDNEDGDPLRYRLSFRREGGKAFHPMHKEAETITTSKYVWETDGVPDGYYRIRVEASDELGNPQDRALRVHDDSEPVLVDNHPPHIDALSVKAGRVVGQVSDNLGPIRLLEYKVDAGDWKLLFPEDDLLDTRLERFSLPLSRLEAGAQLLSVRARDARGNIAIAQVELTP